MMECTGAYLSILFRFTCASAESNGEYEGFEYSCLVWDSVSTTIDVIVSRLFIEESAKGKNMMVTGMLHNRTWIVSLVHKANDFVEVRFRIKESQGKPNVQYALTVVLGLAGVVFKSIALYNKIDAKKSLFHEGIGDIEFDCRKVRRPSLGFASQGFFTVRIDFRMATPKNEIFSVIPDVGKCKLRWSFKNPEDIIGVTLHSPAFALHHCSWVWKFKIERVNSEYAVHLAPSDCRGDGIDEISYLNIRSCIATSLSDVKSVSKEIKRLDASPFDLRALYSVLYLPATALQTEEHGGATRDGWISFDVEIHVNNSPDQLRTSHPQSTTTNASLVDPNNHEIDNDSLSDSDYDDGSSTELEYRDVEGEMCLACKANPRTTLLVHYEQAVCQQCAIQLDMNEDSVCPLCLEDFITTYPLGGNYVDPSDLGTTTANTPEPFLARDPSNKVAQIYIGGEESRSRVQDVWPTDPGPSNPTSEKFLLSRGLQPSDCETRIDAHTVTDYEDLFELDEECSINGVMKGKDVYLEGYLSEGHGGTANIAMQSQDCPSSFPMGALKRVNELVSWKGVAICAALAVSWKLLRKQSYKNYE